MTTEPNNQPMKVLIVGAGVAGLETVMALHDLAGSRVDVTVLTPETAFVYKPLSVREPFAAAGATHYPLAKIAEDFGADLRCGSLAWVAPSAHAAFTDDREKLDYDVLVLALGARRSEPFDDATTFVGSEDSEKIHGLVQDVEGGYIKSVDFVVPPGATWPLPLYELALMLAARAREMGVSPALRLITPEESALAVFGPEASADVAALLEQAGIEFIGSQYVDQPGDSGGADRVVAVPRLSGTAPKGIPADAHLFIRTDTHGRVVGVDDVYAAGDGTDFPIKQGGIASQQADAIAEVVAKRAGARIEPRGFRPVMRSMLLTGGSDRYLRGEVSRGRDGVSEASDHALWWPPTKIAGRYLAPYLEGSEVSAERVPLPADR